MTDNVFLLINNDFVPVGSVDVTNGKMTCNNNITNTEHQDFYQDVGNLVVNNKFRDVYNNIRKRNLVDISSNRNVRYLVIEVQIYRRCLVFSVLKIKNKIPRLLIVGIDIILHSAQCFGTSLSVIDREKLLEEQKQKFIGKNSTVPEFVKNLISASGGLFIGIDDKPTPLE